MTLDAGTRGLVNELIYAVELEHPVRDAFATSVAEAVVAQRIFSSPVAAYRAATERALQDPDALGEQPDDDRRAREFLRRVLRALDDRRPWPELPYKELPAADWTTLLSAPLIGHIDMSPMGVTNQLSRRFTRIADASYGLMLRLQTARSSPCSTPRL